MVKFPTSLFPNISRFITELPLKKGVYGLIISLSIVLSVAIVLQLFDLGRTVRTLQVASAQKESTKAELIYWEDVTRRFPGYRDAYFRAYLAALKLNEKEKADRYMGEILQIDPGFKISRRE